MTETKHFKNLHLQESRLYRQDAKELQECQTQRKKEQEKQEQPKEATRSKLLPSPVASNLQLQNRTATAREQTTPKAQEAILLFKHKPL